jgi:tetratricopeptide (TPR) repeat protein
LDKNKSKPGNTGEQILEWKMVDGLIHFLISEVADIADQEGQWAWSGASTHTGSIWTNFHRDTNPTNALAPGMVLALNNLAVLHCRQEKFTQAEAELKQVCFYSRYYAESRPELFLPVIADSLNSLGLLYQVKENYEKAEAALTGALGIYEIAQANYGACYVSNANLAPWFMPITMSVIQGADAFFDREKISRLDELMEKWRKARDESREISEQDQQELEKLIDEELGATIARLENSEKAHK